METLKIFLGGSTGKSLIVTIAAYGGLTRDLPIPSREEPLLSESQPDQSHAPAQSRAAGQYS
jgi:hypothetical protein